MKKLQVTAAAADDKHWTETLVEPIAGEDKILVVIPLDGFDASKVATHTGVPLNIPVSMVNAQLKLVADTLVTQVPLWLVIEQADVPVIAIVARSTRSPADLFDCNCPEVAGRFEISVELAVHAKDAAGVIVMRPMSRMAFEV